MPPAAPIALVGLPGAGKTTIGALLARRLALPFYDSDADIERETGETIARLFATHGEPHFRALERRTIDRLLEPAPLILATGGGAMTHAATRRILLARATTIWLDAPPHILAARLRGAPNRPLLAGADLLVTLTTLAARRRPHYRKANHRVDADATPESVTARVLALIRP